MIREIPIGIAEKFSLLRKILGENPEGYPLNRAVQESGLSYQTVKKKITEWGYEIIKKKVMEPRIANIIIKKEGDD